MNRAFRADYIKTELKVVLVPGCMRNRLPEECEAKKVKKVYCARDARLSAGLINSD